MFTKGTTSMLNKYDVDKYISLSREHIYYVLKSFHLNDNMQLDIYIRSGYKLHFAFEDITYGDIDIWYEYDTNDFDDLRRIDEEISQWLYKNTKHGVLNNIIPSISNVVYFPAKKGWILRKSLYVETEYKGLFKNSDGSENNSSSSSTD
jgi:hypothetical protein